MISSPIYDGSVSKDDLGRKLSSAFGFSTKTFLLSMIEWNEQGKYNWNYQTYWMGAKMYEWASPEVWKNLHDTFAHFDRKDSWEALLKTIELFRTVAVQISARMDFAYPKDVDENITGFILQQQKNPANSF